MIRKKFQEAQANNYKKALAKNLGVSVRKIKDTDSDDTFYGDLEDREFSVNMGGEEQKYLVLLEDEAREQTVISLENLVDDAGIKVFKGYEYLYESALDENAVDEWLFDDFFNYYNDLDNEDSDDFENRLVEEAYELGVLTEDDFEKTDDGDIDYKKLIDDENITEECARKRLDEMYWEDKVSLITDYSIDGLLDIKDFIDFYEFADNVDKNFGWGHEIAIYDGETNSEEIDGVEYFIFRLE